MARKQIAAFVIVAMAALAPIAAAAGSHYDGKIGKKAALSFNTVEKNGKIVKVKDFAWDGLKCGQDTFTGGLSRPVKVHHGSFSDKQPVGGVSASLKATVTGEFLKNDAKAKGTLKIKGACKTPKQNWNAKRG